MKTNILKIFSFCVVLFFSVGFKIKAQTETPPVYSPTGRINTMLARGDTLIVGGRFSAVGKYTGGGALVTATSDQPNLSFPKINGEIMSSTPDGNGGFYIYGNYYRENESTANSSVRIEHVLADNTFEPNFSISVNTLSVYATKIFFYNGNLYISGQNISQIGGQTAGILSAINVGTKQLSSWIPAVVGTIVTGVFAKGNSLYIIGTFTSVGGVNRQNAASIQIGTGNVRAWNPTPNWANGNGYSDLAFYGNQIILSGGIWDATFTNHACAFVDTLSGSNFRYIFRSGGLFGDGTSALYWAASVNKITISGNVLYAFSGGTFDTRITAVNLLTVNLPNTSGTIWGKYFNMIASPNGMAVIGNSLYVVGGNFDNIYTTNLDNTNPANIERAIKGAIRLNINTGNSENWNPNPVGGYDKSVWTMSVSGNNIFIGGRFTHANGIDRDGIYMVNSQTDEILPFNLIKNNQWYATVNALKIIDNTLYIAGADLKNPTNQNSGSNINSPVVGYNLNTGNVLSWNAPNLGEALAVEANSQYVFIGGNMYEPAGGSGRQHLFAIDRNTGALVNWSPNPNPGVSTLLIANNQLYVGGYFWTISGQSRIKAASYSLPSLTLTNWNPTLGIYDIVNTLFSNNSSTIWLGGGFSSVGGVAKKSFAAVNSTTGSVINSPNPTINPYSVNSIASKGCYMFLGGDFNIIGNTCKDNITAYDFYNKSFNSCYNVNFEVYGGAVRGTAISRNDVFFGGNFLKINGKITAPYIGRIRYPASFFDPCGDFVTVQNGNWNSPMTWNRGTVPPSSAKVTIKHQVTVTQTTSCQSVFEDIGGRIHVNTGVSLNLLKDY